MSIAFQIPQIYDPDFECISTPAPAPAPLQEDRKDFQLCYKAIPHYNTFTQKRAEKLRQKEIKIPESHIHYLEGDNQPIPIKNEHELAHLYLDQIYSKLFNCDISTLNMDAILTIVSRASSFQHDLREQASLVRKEVRNKWLCSNMDLWTAKETEKALAEIEKLTRLIPGSSDFLKKCASTFNRNGFH